MPSKATVCNKTCPAGPPGDSIAGPPGHFTSNEYNPKFELTFHDGTGLVVYLIKNSDTQSAYVRIENSFNGIHSTSTISTSPIPSKFRPDATETMVMQDSFNDLFTFSIDTSGFVTLQTSANAVVPIPAGMEATYPLKIFP